MRNLEKRPQTKTDSHVAKQPDIQAAPNPNMLTIQPLGYDIGSMNIFDQTQTPPDALPKQLQTQLGTAFDLDLSQVRLNRDSGLAKSLGTPAFARGNELHFAQASLDLEQPQTKQLLAHEVAHIAQQTHGQVTSHTNGINDDLTLETQADAMGESALNTSVASLPNSTRGRQRPASGDVMQLGVKSYKSGASSGFKMVIKYDNINDLITSVSYESSYSGKQPHSHRGDHTTAVVTYAHMVDRAVRNKSLKDAQIELYDLSQAILGLPGMQQTKAAQPAADSLNSIIGSLKTSTIDQIPTYMDLITEARNFVPLSANTFSSSSGGNGEGKTSGDLKFGQDQFEKQGKIDYVLQAGDMYNIWKLLDLRKNPASNINELAAIVQQHLLSIKMTYPHMVGPADFGPLLDYAQTTFWVDKVTVYKGFNAIEDTLVKMVKKALGVPESVIYVKNPSDDFKDAFDTTMEYIN